MEALQLVAEIYVAGAVLAFLHSAWTQRHEGWRASLFCAARFAVGWPLVVAILALTIFDRDMRA